MATLLELLQRPAPDPEDPVDLGARVGWIQELAAAVDAAAADLGDDVAAAVALDLRASLGAIVAWGRGPRDDESLVQLGELIAGLTQRASATLYRALAAQWSALAGSSTGLIDTDAARDLAAAFAAAAEAVAAGEGVPPAVAGRIARAGSTQR